MWSLKRRDAPGRAGAAASVVWVAILCASACGKPSAEQVSHAASPLELRVPLVRDIRTLDPHSGDAQEILTHNVLRQLFEGLVEYDPATLEIVPRVASGWEIGEQGLLFSFRLHDGVRFIDDACFPEGRGREITAADVEFSLERALRLREGGGGGADLPAIVGIAEFLDGRADAVEGISVDSDDAIEIHLQHPDPSLLHFLAGPHAFLVAPEAVAAYGEQLKVHPVGTGPFRLVSWNPPTGVLLARHRGYWRTDASGIELPHVDALRFVQTFNDETVAYRLYVAGRLDSFLTYAFGPDERFVPGPVDTEVAESREYMIPWLNTIYFRFDHRSDHPVVKDVRLRRALAHALPRGFPPIHLPARGLLPPTLPGHDPGLVGQVTDREAALALLREAGYPDGRGLPPLKLIAPDWAGGIARRFTEELRGLGIAAEIEILDQPTFRRRRDAGAADLFRDGWIAKYPDPQNFLQLFNSQSPNNFGHYSNPRYDELFEKLRREWDPGQRRMLARRLERILIEDAAALFHRHERVRQFVSSRVADWEINCTNPMNLRYYERVRLLR